MVGAGVDEEQLLHALEALGRGELIVYPTDTLYALGADALDIAAVQRCFAAKRRPASQAMSVCVADVEDIATVARLTPLARRLADRFLPGPLTLVLPPDPGVPDELRGGERGLAVRVPDQPLALELARRFGPITCTSANLHGQPDPRTAGEARAQLGSAASLYLEAGPCLGRASTVVDITAHPPRIVREGALPRKELEPWLGMSTSTM